MRKRRSSARKCSSARKAGLHALVGRRACSQSEHAAHREEFEARGAGGFVGGQPGESQRDGICATVATAADDGKCVSELRVHSRAGQVRAPGEERVKSLRAPFDGGVESAAQGVGGVVGEGAWLGLGAGTVSLARPIPNPDNDGTEAVPRWDAGTL